MPKRIERIKRSRHHDRTPYDRNSPGDRGRNSNNSTATERLERQMRFLRDYTTFDIQENDKRKFLENSVNEYFDSIEKGYIGYVTRASAIGRARADLEMRGVELSENISDFSEDELSSQTLKDWAQTVSDEIKVFWYKEQYDDLDNNGLENKIKDADTMSSFSNGIRDEIKDFYRTAQVIKTLKENHSKKEKENQALEKSVDELNRSINIYNANQLTEIKVKKLPLWDMLEKTAYHNEINAIYGLDDNNDPTENLSTIHDPDEVARRIGLDEKI